MEVLKVKDVTVSFGKVKALENVELDLDEGELLVVMGPNGAGKTTLLRVILGLLKPLKGEVRVLGYNPFSESELVRHLIGYVPQRRRISTVVPMRVLDVVLMGVMSSSKPPRVPRSRDFDAAIKALKVVGMEDYSGELFKNLSTGQQQRVLIARALCRSPKLLLLDEPFNGVDVSSQKLILETLEQLKLKSKMSIVMVTHDVNPIVEVMDRVALLNKKIIAIGAPEEVLREDVLSSTYGSKIKVLTHEGKCYAIVGDTHGHH